MLLLIRLLARKLSSLLAIFPMLFRRAMCFLSRKHAYDPGVPVSTVGDSESQHHVIPMDTEWDSFDPVVNKQQRLIQDYYSQRALRNGSDSQQPNEPDFFSDMHLQPSVIRTKKLLVRKQHDDADDPPPAQRFRLDTSALEPNLTPVLLDFHEEPQTSYAPTDNWDFEEDNVNPGEVLKAARQKERDARRQLRVTSRS